MIKIGPGLGSMYFSARNAGSTSGPATLTIEFGQGVTSDDTFYLTINGVQYSISFGLADASDVPIYRDNEGSLETYSGDYIRNAFASYIGATFSSSLTVTTLSGDRVTLTTKATGPTANLSAVCALPIFPNVPLGYIDAVFVSGAGTEEANGLYVPNGIIAGRTTYLNTNASGINIFWDNIYNVYRILVSDLLYYTSNSPANPWDGIYSIYEGSEPIPTVRQATTADS